ncbi:unnamed protein product, partial [Mesorhabditis spiculigera]
MFSFLSGVTKKVNDAALDTMKVVKQQLETMQVQDRNPLRELTTSVVERMPSREEISSIRGSNVAAVASSTVTNLGARLHSFYDDFQKNLEKHQNQSASSGNSVDSGIGSFEANSNTLDTPSTSTGRSRFSPKRQFPAESSPVRPSSPIQMEDSFDLIISERQDVLDSSSTIGRKRSRDQLDGSIEILEEDVEQAEAFANTSKAAAKQKTPTVNSDVQRNFSEGLAEADLSEIPGAEGSKVMDDDLTGFQSFLADHIECDDNDYCQICKRTCSIPDLKAAIAHLSMHFETNKVIECPACPYVNSSRRMVTTHIHRVHPLIDARKARKYIVEGLCNHESIARAVFPNNTELPTKLIAHYRTEKFKACNMMMDRPYPRTLLTHMKNYHDLDAPFLCKCGFKAITHDQIQDHLKQPHDDPASLGDFIDKRSDELFAQWQKETKRCFPNTPYDLVKFMNDSAKD